MAQLSRHPSLRFSVFEVAVDIGLDTGAFDGNFAPIVEEDESEVSLFAIRRSILVSLRSTLHNLKALALFYVQGATATATDTFLR
ncbi:hypothetical protein FRC15_009110 [Serendipita sp. 397]|nr:hypothetical protein FRC15_009110 [Serendipita sp. 397]